MKYPNKKYRLKIYLKDNVIKEFEKFFDNHNDCEIYIGRILRDLPKFCKYELFVRKNENEETLIESSLINR